MLQLKKCLPKAYKEGYAIGAFNVNNMEMIQAIVEAANECRSPVILQVSAGARKYANPVYLKHLDCSGGGNNGYSHCYAS